MAILLAFPSEVSALMFRSEPQLLRIGHRVTGIGSGSSPLSHVLVGVSWPHGGEAKKMRQRPRFLSVLLLLRLWKQKAVGQATLLPGIWVWAKSSPILWPQSWVAGAISSQPLAATPMSGHLPEELVAGGPAPSPAWGGKCGKGSIAELRAAIAASYHLFLH